MSKKLINKKMPFVPLNIKYNRAYFIVGAVVFTLTRFMGDLLLYVFSSYNSPTVIIWKTLTSVFIILSIFLYVFSKPFDEHELVEDKSAEEFFRELSRVIYMALGLIVLQIIMPLNLIRDGQPDGIIMLIITDISAMGAIIISIYTAYFLNKWLLIRRHKQTKLFIYIMTLCLLYFFVVDFIYTTFSLIPLPFLSIVFTVIVFILSIIVFVTARRNSWIAVLPKSYKIRHLWFTMLGSIISIFLYVVSLDNGNTFYSMFDLFFPGLSEIVSIIFLYSGIYYGRLFLATVAALPTTRIVERKTSEISSLTYLNKLVSQSVDFDGLLDTVSRLALNASQGSASWVELYDKDGRVSFTSNLFIEKKQLEDMHNGFMGEKLMNSRTGLLIESIPEYDELGYVLEINKDAKALMAVPLYAGEERIGTLAVINPEEYGFENDDLKVLLAFGDNVNVALENARLLQDSIEKEHYQREMDLAKQMQQKLLPQHVPEINKFSIAAVSIPAEEVGGDYYDFVELKDGRQCILIGDVSGKGMNAAFYMAQLKGVVLSVARLSSGAADILKRINYTLYGTMEKQMYITMSSLVIDPGKKTIQLARAGHMPSICKLNGEMKEIKPMGIGIGLCDSSIFDSKIEEIEIELNDGELCLMYTDGLNELRFDDNTEFGIEPIKEICDNSNTGLAEELNNEIIKRINDLAGSINQHDDMTIVSMIYTEKN